MSMQLLISPVTALLAYGLFFSPLAAVGVTGPTGPVGSPLLLSASTSRSSSSTDSIPFDYPYPFEEAFVPDDNFSYNGGRLTAALPGRYSITVGLSASNAQRVSVTIDSPGSFDTPPTGPVVANFLPTSSSLPIVTTTFDVDLVAGSTVVIWNSIPSINPLTLDASGVRSTLLDIRALATNKVYRT